jgi:hypothetical protein
MTKARSNAVANAAKGDLTVGNGTNLSGILAVGSNGDTLVADSSTSTGLRYTAGTVQSNPVLNSAMQIWQRGTSFTIPSSSITYTADRWAAYRGATGATVTRQTTSDSTNLPFIQYCTRIARDSGNTSTAGIYFGYSFDSVNTIPFAGKTVTFSYYARRGANYSATSNLLVVQFYTGTGTDQNVINGYTGLTTVLDTTSTLTTTWQRFTHTFTIASTATEMGFNYVGNVIGTAGAADFYEITGVQIDIGSTALPFRTYAGTIQGELAACQRYYEKSYDIATTPGSAVAGGSVYLTQASDGGNNSAYALRFKVEKRNSSWSAAYFTTAGTASNWQYARSGVSATNVAATTDLQASTGTRLYFNVGAAWTANTIQGHWVVDNEL